MVFHELATNSAKWPMSAKSGRVSVRWSFSRDERAERWLRLRWEESGGPLVAEPTRWGFGTSVIRDLVPYQLGGTATSLTSPGGFAAICTYPRCGSVLAPDDRIASPVLVCCTRFGPLLMLWTAPPPARECHGSGCC